MKKILIPIICLIFIIVIGLVISHVYKEKQENNLETDPKPETSFLTSTVLKINDGYVTLQDESNIIYTFLINDAVGLEVGENIKLEYKGNLNQESLLQENEVVGYKLINNEKSEIPSTWNDEGLFSKFYKYAYDTLKDMSLDEKIGQILLVRVPESKQIEDLKKYNFGGYLLFQRDFDGKSKNEVLDMIKSYQDNSKIPLLIASDEEGGTVTRISKNKNLVKEPFKSPQDLYKAGGLELIKEDTIEKSKILKELGINLNLAPVVDVSENEKDYMYKRSLGQDATVTSDYATTVINASKGLGVSYTLKHFPGYGNNSDTHVGESIDGRDYDEIINKDILPFKAGIEAGAEAVLVSHNTVQAIDKEKPASLSSNVHNLLRANLDFTGIIITDDLSMGAIDDKYAETAVVDAILAGNDLLIVTDYSKSIKDIKDAITKGELTEDMISKLAFRVIAWKYYKGLLIPNQK